MSIQAVWLHTQPEGRHLGYDSLSLRVRFLHATHPGRPRRLRSVCMLPYNHALCVSNQSGF